MRFIFILDHTSSQKSRNRLAKAIGDYFGLNILTKMMNLFMNLRFCPSKNFLTSETLIRFRQALKKSLIKPQQQQKSNYSLQFVINRCQNLIYLILNSISSYILISKMQKKPKIVNISLNSPQNTTTTVIHLPRQHLNERLNIFNEQTGRHLVKDCIEAINVISTQKKKQIEKERKAIKAFGDSSKNPKKIEKQPEITLSLKVAQSVEQILRKFILFQVEEKHQKTKNTVSRQKKLQQKTKLYKTLLLKPGKENVDGIAQDSKSIQTESQMFKNFLKADKSKEKQQSKVNALQSQLAFCKEKLAEKCNLIAKLESKQSILRKKYNNEVQKIARYKNILNINTLFEKEFEEKENGKYLMKISGQNFSRKRQYISPQLHSQQTNRSSILQTSQGSLSKINKRGRKTVQTSPAETKRKCQAKKLRFLDNMQNINSLESFKQGEKQTKSSLQTQKKGLQLKKQVSRISILKRELEEFYREKQRTIQTLNEASIKLQRHIQELETKITQKMKEISLQQQLLTDQQLKMLKQIDSQNLHLTGFQSGKEFFSIEALE